MLRRRKRGGDRGGGLSLYYASDVHGSDLCWRKFLGAGAFYGVQTLIMGGDLTGKAIIPIVATGDGEHHARFLGEDREVTDGRELDELVAAIRMNGMYPWLTDAAEVARADVDEASRGQLFDEVISREVRRWVELADERLADTDVKGYVIAGNDDPLYVDGLLGSSESLELCDGQITRVGDHEMLSLSYANRTPWSSPRELDEDELYVRIKGMAEQLENPRSAIFNLHVPPYDSGLDHALKIDADFRPVLEGGSTVQVPVGSKAVRRVLEEFQPLLSLHGHIHESRGVTRIGDCVAINSGSEYNTGRIHGVVVHLRPDASVQHQFVVG